MYTYAYILFISKVFYDTSFFVFYFIVVCIVLGFYLLFFLKALSNLVMKSAIEIKFIIIYIIEMEADDSETAFSKPGQINQIYGNRGKENKKRVNCP